MKESKLIDLLSVIHAEMDIACNCEEAISRKQVNRWGCMIREALGNVCIDSEWLTSIGFVQNSLNVFTFNGRLVVGRDWKQWKAFLSKTDWHFLCDVNCREDVLKLVEALKLNGSQS